MTAFYFEIRTGTRTIYFTKDVGHASLVSEKGGGMHRFGAIILGECLAFAPMAPAPLFGQKAPGSVARRRELSMRLKCIIHTYVRQ